MELRRSPNAPRSLLQQGILVVEDDDSISAYIQAVLEEADFYVRVARNGCEGLAILSRWTPDLILVDLMMPVMDGREFCYQQRHHLRTASVPVILMSALPGINRLIESLELAAVLPKPFSVTSLLSAVNAALVRVPA